MLQQLMLLCCESGSDDACAHRPAEAGSSGIGKALATGQVLEATGCMPRFPYDQYCCFFCILSMHRLCHISFSAPSRAAWDAGHNGGG